MGAWQGAAITLPAKHQRGPSVAWSAPTASLSPPPFLFTSFSCPVSARRAPTRSVPRALPSMEQPCPSCSPRGWVLAAGVTRCPPSGFPQAPSRRLQGR